MRRTILTLVAVTAAMSVAALAAETKKTTLNIKGMSCDGCAATVNGPLKGAAGIANYDLKLERGTVDLTYDPEGHRRRHDRTVDREEGFPGDPPALGARRCFVHRLQQRVLRVPDAEREGHRPPTGAAVGQKVYCPVSGVVIAIKESTLSEEIEGKPLYVCCEGCKRYVAANRERVLALRGIDHAKQPTE